MLIVQNLKKQFGGIKAIDDCSFEVKENTITALIGPNGSGKTTIFNIISGIYEPDEGKIIFNGVDITEKLPEDISNLGISRLFQQARLFNNLTVKENLLLAFDNEDTKFWKNILGLNKITQEKEKKIKECLRITKMEKFENHITRNLSYGQKRLVELVRTILNPHKFLMLDEPVAGVTPALRQKIKEILRKLKKDGETILLIEHDMNFTFDIAEKIIVLNEGKVIAEGRPEEIKQNPLVLETYLGE